MSGVVDHNLHLGALSDFLGSLAHITEHLKGKTESMTMIPYAAGSQCSKQDRFHVCHVANETVLLENKYCKQLKPGLYLKPRST